MRISIKSVLFLVLMPWIVGCQTSGVGNVNTGFNNLALGDQYAGVVRVGTQDVPLLDGEWTLASWDQTRNNNNNSIIHALFVRKNDKFVDGVIKVRTNGDVVAGGWLPPKLCSRGDVHFKKTISYGNDVCWVVNHWNFLQNLKGVSYGQQQAVDLFARQNDIVPPSFGLAKEFFFERSGKFLYVAYVSVPEAQGFDRLEGYSWSSHPWHRTTISADMKKVEYVQRETEWAHEWFDVVSSYFGHY